MASEVIYSDKLVEITDDEILFRNYHFPFGSSRLLKNSWAKSRPSSRQRKSGISMVAVHVNVK